MLSIVETKRGFKIGEAPAPAKRLGCGCAALAMAALGLFVFVMTFLPQPEVTLDCNRARGTCTDLAQTIPLAQIQSAALVRDSRGGEDRGNTVHTVSMALEMADGKPIWICTSPENLPAAHQLAADVDLANVFFKTPSTPAFSITCAEDLSTTGERIYYPIVGAIFLVLAVIGFSRLSSARIVFDAKARRASIGRLRFSFSEISSVEIANRRLTLTLRDRPPCIIDVATNDEEDAALIKIRDRIQTMLA